MFRTRAVKVAGAGLAAALMLSGCGADSATSVTEAGALGGQGEATPTPLATLTETPTPTPTPTPTEDVNATTVLVTDIIDGDTIDTDAGRVRVIGIDTPERGECGYAEASANAAAVTPVGTTVVLTAVPGNDSTDKYGRLLRYVTSSTNADLGLTQIQKGFATARYDSRDGYDFHPKEPAYVAADVARANFACAAVAPKPTSTATTKPATPKPTATATKRPTTAPKPPATKPTSAYYANCDAVRAAGKAPLFAGQPGYSFKLDRDKDGVACE